MNSNPILLVEDDDNDVFLMARMVKKVGIPNALEIVRDGHEAVDYLSGRGVFGDRGRFPLPALVLLDLNLPGRSGLEVMKWIRQQPPFQSLLVIVFSSSSAISDIDRAYRLGANSYLVKPSSPTELMELLTALKHYWLRFNQPPPAG